MATSRFSDDLADAICERVGRGESVVGICASKDMPHEVTVYRWLADPEKQDFCRMYTRAREVAAERFADEMVGIADSVRNGATSEDVQAARLAIDTRKWIASKHSPRKYGDKITHSGDPENPVKVITQISYVIVDPKEPGSTDE